MSFTAHKIYGPKGIGASGFAAEPRRRLEPQIAGGGHERGMRSGTLNVPGIMGFSTCYRTVFEEMPTEAVAAGGLRDRLFDGLSGRAWRTFRSTARRSTRPRVCRAT